MRKSVRHDAATFWQVDKRKKATKATAAARRKAKNKRRKCLKVQKGLTAGPKYLYMKGDPHPLPGIRKALRKTFWNNFDHPYGKRKSQKGVTKDIGLRVEEQIEEWHKARQTPKTKPKKPRLNYARLFCAWVRANNYEIVASQHPIYDTASGLSTRIDFVLTDGDVYYLVELKVGYNYGFDMSQGTMTHIDSVPCSPRNQCLFQLAWMNEVCKREKLFDAPVVPLLVVLTNSLVKRAKVGKKAVETLAKHLRTADAPKIAFPLPPRITKIAPQIHQTLSSLFTPRTRIKRNDSDGPEVIDLT
jgi:hypothetical protein